jgi:hypothetical protein
MYRVRQKTLPIREASNEPVSLLGVLEAQNAELRNTVVDLAIRTAILRRKVAAIENAASLPSHRRCGAARARQFQ